jgi:hypothetical protein
LAGYVFRKRVIGRVIISGSLISSDRLHETIRFCIEEDEVVLVTDDLRISIKNLFHGLPEPGIGHNFPTFTLLLFFDTKSMLDVLLVTQEMVNL